MDEAEEEIDRLEHSKKKLQRDLDEQQESNEQLQSQLKSLRSEIRWMHKDNIWCAQFSCVEDWHYKMLKQ